MLWSEPIGKQKSYPVLIMWGNNFQQRVTNTISVKLEEIALKNVTTQIKFKDSLSRPMANNLDRISNTLKV